MLLAMGCYVMNDAFVKLAADRLAPGQILAIRGGFASVLVLAFMPRSRTFWRHLHRPIMGLRCVLEVTTAVASVSALSLAPLATVTSLMMTAPLLIAVVAMALHWERWKWRRVIAVGLGFAGTLLVIHPTNHFPPPTMGIAIALLCAASLAGRDLMTRRMPASISSAAITAATTLAVTAAGCWMGALEEWAMVTQRELAALAGAAAFAAAGNYALVASCRESDLSVVTPFRYSIIVWSLLLGYVIWGETPGMVGLTGVALIAAAGAYTVCTSLSPRD